MAGEGGCQMSSPYYSQWSIVLSRNLFNSISKQFFLVILHFRSEIILDSYLRAKVVSFSKVPAKLGQFPMNKMQFSIC